MNESHSPLAEGTGPVITYKNVAELLGVPVGTLYSWVHSKCVPHLRFGRRHVRFEVSALRAWMDSKRVGFNDGRTGDSPEGGR